MAAHLGHAQAYRPSRFCPPHLHPTANAANEASLKLLRDHSCALPSHPLLSKDLPRHNELESSRSNVDSARSRCICTPGSSACTCSKTEKREVVEDAESWGLPTLPDVLSWLYMEQGNKKQQQEEQQQEHCRQQQHIKQQPKQQAQQQKQQQVLRGGCGFLDSARGCLFSAPASQTSPCQDATLLWEGGQGNASFTVCAVMGGHGPHGASVVQGISIALPRVISRRLGRALGISQDAAYQDKFSWGIGESPCDSLGLGLPALALNPCSSVGHMSSSTCMSTFGQASSGSDVAGSPTSSCSDCQSELSRAPSQDLDGVFPFLESGEVLDELTVLKGTLEEDPEANEAPKQAGEEEEERLEHVPHSLLTKVFEDLHEVVRKDPGIFPLCSGSSVVVSVLVDRQLTVAHVGDSRCVLAMEDSGGTLEAVVLTADHRPSVPSERRRIEGTGARVLALRDEPHVARVWMPGADFPGLAISRTVGNDLVSSYGVSCEPEILRICLDDSAKFVILGTAGLWSALSAAEAVRLVSRCCDRVQGAQRLVSAAQERLLASCRAGDMDDISAVVYHLSPLSVHC